MSTRTRTPVTDVRLGGRNRLHVGDPVKVAPSKPRRRDGFVGDVVAIYDYGDDPVEVTVYGAPAGRMPSVRTFFLDRLTRVNRDTTPTHQHGGA